MKKLLSLFVFSTLFLTSCAPSDSSPVTENTMLLKQVTIAVEGDGSQTFNFTYNGMKIVKVQGEGLQPELKRYFYTGNLITKIQHSNFGGPVVEEETFAYNASGQLITYFCKEPTENWAERSDFVYNADNTITRTTYDGSLASQTELESTYVLHLSNGEITEVDVNPGSTNITFTYAYDTKNNPFRNVIGYDKIYFALKTDELRDENVYASGMSHNFLSIRQMDSMGEITRTKTVANTYNSFNFPSTSINTIQWDIMTPPNNSSTVTTQFIYY